MIRKLDNKGFTLVELLATIVILAIISTVTVVAVTGYFQNSKETSEQIFIKQIGNYVDDYVSLSGSKLSYDNGVTKNKCYKNYDGNLVCEEVTLFSSSSLEIETVINNIVNEPIINPSSEIKCTNANTKLTIYRDSDFVYCFKLEKEGMESCINDTIDTCSSIYSGAN